MTNEEAKEILSDVSAYLASYSKLTNDTIAGHSYLDICRAITILKSNSDEEKQNNEIKVGDEVKYCDVCGEEVSGIVTNINADYPYAFVMNKNGEFSTVVTSKLFKTGRHFKEIEYVLKQMKGDNNE